MSDLFSSKKTSTSSGTTTNAASPFLQQSLGGAVGNTGHASDAIAAMLGIGGDGAAQGAAFDNYKNSTGYQSTLDAGSHAITNSNAAKGFLQSGATGKALSNFGQQTNQNYYQNYMNQLLGLGQLGLGAGGLISGAATKTSQGTQTDKSKPGLGAMLGTIAAGIPGL
jgi:hypothetical protein